MLAKDRHVDQLTRLGVRDKPSHVWPNGFDKGTKTVQRGRQSFQQMALKKLDFHMWKNEVGPSPNTI